MLQVFAVTEFELTRLADLSALALKHDLCTHTAELSWCIAMSPT